MAEIHIIGQILHAIDFEQPNLFCKWSIQFGKFRKLSFDWIRNEISSNAKGSNWKQVEGYIEGQTATCRGRFNGRSSFAHPIDVHLSCRGIQGWPKIHVEVYAVNALSNCFPVGWVSIIWNEWSNRIDLVSYKGLWSYNDMIESMW